MSPYQQRTVAVGGGALDGADLVLDLGRHHPSTHGMLRLALTLDGDRIVTADPLVGYLHRGAEKLFEVRDYRQIMVLANRHDWLSAFSNELGVALAVERMMGLDVPPRATWLRTLLAELNRVLAHLMFLGASPLTQDETFHAVAEREGLLRVMEEVSGGRVHYMFNRIGGLKEDVPAGWPGRTRRAVQAVRVVWDQLDSLISADAFAARTRGVGVLSAGDASSYGVSGPVARASGLDFDLRRDDPYLSYGELGFGAEFAVVLGTSGDSLARYRCLLDQVRVSLELADACLDALPGGPVNVRLPKTVRAPEGHTYCWTESPLGVMGYYLVSRGEKTPWRLAMRTPSFNNVSALAALLPGVALADLVTVLGSMFFVIGDIDK